MKPYILIRSDRRSVGIRVRERGEVEVRAPKRLPVAEIEKILSRHTAFIERAISRQKELSEKKQAHSFNYGDCFLFLGKEYPLIAKEGARGCFDGEKFVLPTGLSGDEIMHKMTEIYKKKAREILPGIVDKCSEIMSLFPSRVTVTSAKTRWGSCGGKNTLNFSWRLILASPDTVETVVIHELSHILHRNHGAQFKKTVAVYAPDPARADRELKTLAEYLSAQSWQ